MEVITWNGKCYPRWLNYKMSLTEAMHRLGATKVKYGCPDKVIIFANMTDVPEGVELCIIPMERYTYNYGPDADHTTYRVCIDDVDRLLRQRGLPGCKVPSPELQNLLDDVKIKESKVDYLRQIADAATFAIEQSKEDSNCEVTNELLTHWHGQEHSYLVALGELEAARANLKKLS